MTVVVGFLDKKEHKLYMGADRCISAGDRRTTLNFPKYFRFDAPGNFGDILIGWAGAYKHAQVLQHKFIAPPHINSKSVDEYLSTDFIDTMQECLFSRIVAEPNELGMLESHLSLIILYGGRIFSVDPHMCVLEADLDFAACGSGEEFALGSMYTMNMVDTDSSVPAEQVVLSALFAAEMFSTGVTQPFDIEFVEIPEHLRWYEETDEEEIELVVEEEPKKKPRKKKEV